MMTANPTDRKSAKEMLSHPFFDKYPQNDAYLLPPPEDLEQTSKNISEFMKYSRFEKFIISMVNGLEASKEQINKLND